MHLTLLALGKLKEPTLRKLYEEYEKRLLWKVTLQEGEDRVQRAQQSDFFISRLIPSSFSIALDEKGENLSSETFAKLLQNIQLHHHGKATFMIGGADGLPSDAKEKATMQLSFGHMTWPHLWARVMLMEQLYRAQQILSSHPYHRS